MFVGKVGRRAHDQAAGTTSISTASAQPYACEKAGQVEAVVDRYVSSGLVKAEDRETFLQTALTQVTLADGRARGRQECGAFACMCLRTRVYARARVAAYAPVGSRVRQITPMQTGVKCKTVCFVLMPFDNGSFLDCPILSLSRFALFLRTRAYFSLISRFGLTNLQARELAFVPTSSPGSMRSSATRKSERDADIAASAGYTRHAFGVCVCICLWRACKRTCTCLCLCCLPVLVVGGSRLAVGVGIWG